MKRYFFLLILLLQVVNTLFSENTKSKSPAVAVNSGAPQNEQEKIDMFLQPVRFNSFGLKDFYQNIFNSTFYAERFLPSCFIHITDFIEHGKKTGYPRSYVVSVFDTFHLRLKESAWVNSYALLALMERLPELMTEYLTYQEDKDEQTKKTIKKELQNALVKKFSLLRKNPEKFLEDTVNQIVKSINKDEEEENSERNLQNTIKEFLEGAINKLIWNPYDKIDVWRSVKLIAEKCEELYDYDIIRTEVDLNNLIWSLLYRFGYFVDCAGSQMPTNFYQKIIKEINSEKLALLKPYGQEELITKKHEYLEKKINEGIIKSSAHESGIITDGLA